MARRFDHDKVTQTIRGARDSKPRRTTGVARRDAASIAARSRPTVDEMVADVMAARDARPCGTMTRSPLDDLDEDEPATC
jgi:hypothetical protein